MIFIPVEAYLLPGCIMQTDHAPFPQLLTGNYKTYLALGDSYTIGQSVTEAERFPAQTVNLLKKDNITFNKSTVNGQHRLQQL